MIKFFDKFKKTLFLAHFWFIFPILGAKRLPESLDRRKEGWKYQKMDRPYFTETFQLLPRVQKSSNQWIN